MVRSAFAFSCSASSLCPVLLPETPSYPLALWQESLLVGWPPPFLAIHTQHTCTLSCISTSSAALRQPFGLYKTKYISGPVTSVPYRLHMWGLHEWLLPIYTEETFVEFCRVVFREAESSRVLNLHWKVEFYPKKVEVGLAQRHVSHWTVKKCIRGNLTLLLVVLHSAF